MNIKNVLIALLGLSIATAVSAADTNQDGAGSPNKQQPEFSDIDTDSDGKISEQELTEFRKQRITEQTEEGRTLKNVSRTSALASYDKDKDGFISEEEFNQHKRYSASSKANKQTTKKNNKNKNSGNGNGNGNGKGKNKG